jgi:hypothetical protein
MTCELSVIRLPGNSAESPARKAGCLTGVCRRRVQTPGEDSPHGITVTAGTVTALGCGTVSASFFIVESDPKGYKDPDGNTTIYNLSSNYIIIRDEDGQTHTVQPSERYSTDAHGASAIDGILFHDGSAYKTNNGNDFTTFTVTEGDEGYKVGETLGNVTRDNVINIVKLLGNIIRPNRTPSDYAGMHYQDDGSVVSTQWWETANTAYSDNYVQTNEGKLPDKNLKDMSREEWNAALKDFKQYNPDGM